MFKYIFLLALAIAAVSAHVNTMDLNKDTPFEHKYEISDGPSGDKYTMYWNHSDTEICIKLESKTPGWLSFGLSPRGSVSNTDFVLAWLDPATGTVIFKDCYNTADSVVYVDAEPKWTLRFSDFSSSTKTIIFSRFIDTCYAPNEVVVSPSNSVIFSKGSTYDMNGLPKYSDSFASVITSGIVPLLAELNHVTKIVSPSSFEETQFVDSVS